MKDQMIVFDVDGVLINEDKGGFKDTLERLGREEEVARIDEEYQKRKHEGPWGLPQLAQAYQGFGRDTLKEEAEQYCEERLVEGAEEVVAELKEGFVVGALSSNPQFIMNRLKEILGLDFVGGCQLEYENGKATGNLIREVNRYGKAEILEEKKEEYDILQTRVIVIGDSLTDLPMAEQAEFFIGFNAKPEISEEVDVKVESLEGVLSQVRNLDLN